MTTRKPKETRAERMIGAWYALDRALVAAGYHASTPWWNKQIERLYRSGKRQGVFRVGRRGGKSTTVARLCVLEALYGEHHVSPGDRGIVGVVSANRRPQGEDLIATIGAMLTALRVPHDPTAESIDLTDRPVTFRVHSASVRGVIGGSWIFACLDEVSHWAVDNASNPAEEIIAAVRPCIAPSPHGLLLLISAPAGTEDAHAALFDRGETDGQIIAWAPTWIARPSLTEAELRAFEQDERYFARDYGAVPQAGLSDALDVASLRDCVRPLVPSRVLGAPICVMDQSGGKVDGMPWAIFRWVLEGAHRVLHVTGLQMFEGGFASSLTQDAVAETIANAARAARAHLIVGDQHGAWAWQGSFRRAGGMPFESLAWTNDNKSEAVVRARQLIRERAIAIEPGPLADRLLREAARFRERVLSTTGLITFSAAGRGHDDLIMMLLLGLAYDAKARLSGSTMFAPVERATSAPRTSARALGSSWYESDGRGGWSYFACTAVDAKGAALEIVELSRDEWMHRERTRYGQVVDRRPGETVEDVREQIRTGKRGVEVGPDGRFQAGPAVYDPSEPGIIRKQGTTETQWDWAPASWR